MKKRLLWTSVIAAVLLFGGCSSKNVATDEKSQVNTEQQMNANNTNNGSEASASETEEVSSETQEVATTNSTDTTEDRIKALESELHTVYFDFDKFDIRQDMVSNVDHNAHAIASLKEDFKVKLEGNCDEWGSDEYNFALGLKRAKSVKDALVADGVDESKISIVSYGESNPVCTEHTKECWQKNRRVDFKVIP